MWYLTEVTNTQQVTSFYIKALYVFKFILIFSTINKVTYWEVIQQLLLAKVGGRYEIISF